MPLIGERITAFLMSVSMAARLARDCVTCAAALVWSASARLTVACCESISWRDGTRPPLNSRTCSSFANSAWASFKVASAWSQPERAARLLGAVATQFDIIGRSVVPLIHEEIDQTHAALRAALGAERFAAAWAEGRHFSFEAAVDEALRVEAAPESAKTTAPTSVHGLSQREMEVLRLLAQRYTDPEIAEALSIAARTASSHVTSIFNKLGVRNRREAAAIAVRSGLV